MPSVPPSKRQRRDNPQTSRRRFHDPIKRFWERVQKSEAPDGCWLWTGTRTSKGYGVMSIDWVNTPMHRFSYELHHGPLPAGLLACHTCDNPPCVNPNHIFPGTHVDNAQDMVRKGRRGNVIPPRHTGEQHPQAKLTWSDVDAIRSMRKQGMQLLEIARLHHVSTSTISLIVKYAIWRRDGDPDPFHPGTRKLTDQDIVAIRTAWTNGARNKDLSSLYNVSPATITRIVI